jgi:hypothetical protein
MTHGSGLNYFKVSPDSGLLLLNVHIWSPEIERTSDVKAADIRSLLYNLCMFIKKHLPLNKLRDFDLELLRHNRPKDK